MGNKYIYFKHLNLIIKASNIIEVEFKEKLKDEDDYLIIKFSDNTTKRISYEKDEQDKYSTENVFGKILLFLSNDEKMLWV